MPQVLMDCCRVIALDVLVLAEPSDDSGHIVLPILSPPAN